MAEILLFLFSENKQPPYWKSTSGFNFDLSAVIGTLFSTTKKTASLLLLLKYVGIDDVDAQLRIVPASSCVNPKMVAQSLLQWGQRGPDWLCCTWPRDEQYTVFQKKTPTHIVGYKLRNSCLILIIFDTKIPDII